MALAEPTGWSPHTEWVESVWHADPAVQWECPALDAIERANGEAVPQHADDCAHCAGTIAYLADGRREHLTIRDGATPTRIRYRALTACERAMIRDEVARKAPVQDDGESALDYFRRCEVHRTSSLGLHAYLAATVALDFPEWAVPRIDWQGLKVMPAAYVSRLGNLHGDGFLRDYGLWIWTASTATEAQKKTSSSISTAKTPAPLTVADASANPNGSSASPARTSDLSTCTP